MPFERRILHHGPDPAGVPQLLQQSAIRSCWFELHRQGGCGAGEVVLSDVFEHREEVAVGDWISFEPLAGSRWYLGRVEERVAESPARVRLRLEGMGIELNEVFPGGFGLDADGAAPHRYAATDLFSLDPDRSLETLDHVTSADQVVRLLLTQYVAPASHITYVPGLVETPALSAPLTSMKVRGEETARALVKDLAVRAQSASWGVNGHGEFFFLKRRQATLLTLREGRDLTRLAETRDRDLLFNRILLTGDYVYDRRDHSDDAARRSSRWRGTFFEPTSREEHGDRRIRLWLPWVRTQADSLAFAKEFFRTYSQPQARFLVETSIAASLPLPWLGRVRLEDRHGAELITARPETVRVQFDHAPLLRLELGPEDPRQLWPEPPHDERWELPDRRPLPGGAVSYSDWPSGEGTSGALSGLTTSSTTGESDGEGDSSLDSDGPTSGESSGASTSDMDDITDSLSGSSDSEEGDTSTSGSEDSTSGEDDSDESSSGPTSDSEGSDTSLSSGELDTSDTSADDSESDGDGDDSSDGGGDSLESSGSSGSSGETDPITFVW